MPHRALDPDLSPSMRPTPNYGTYPSPTQQEFRRAYNPAVPWGSSPRERITSGSSKQTALTTSLTTIIDNYSHSPLFYHHKQPPHTTKPNNNDFSEEFEDVREDVVLPP